MLKIPFLSKKSREDIAHENTKRLMDHEMREIIRYKGQTATYLAEAEANRKQCEKNKIAATVLLEKNDAKGAQHYRKMADKSDETYIVHQQRANMSREQLFDAQTRRGEFKALKREIQERQQNRARSAMLSKNEQKGAIDALIDYLGDEEFEEDGHEELNEAAEEIRKYLGATVPTAEDYVAEAALKNDARASVETHSSEFIQWNTEFQKELEKRDKPPEG